MPLAQMLSEEPEKANGASRSRQLSSSEERAAPEKYFGPLLVNYLEFKDEQARQLSRSFADGNVDAFWRLWDLHNRHLYHLCLWQMGGVREDAEEALSRAMLKAFSKLPSNSYRIQNLRAWLSKLTVNLCVDLHRERTRRLRRLESIEDILFGAPSLLLAGAKSPEEAFLSREVFAHLCHAVNNLPSRLREPFVLRFLHEMTYPDIAEHLLLTRENVRKRIQQARVILREQLKLVRQVRRTTNRSGNHRLRGSTRCSHGSCSGGSQPF